MYRWSLPEETLTLALEYYEQCIQNPSIMGFRLLSALRGWSFRKPAVSNADAQTILHSQMILDEEQAFQKSPPSFDLFLSSLIQTKDFKVFSETEWVSSRKLDNQTTKPLWSPIEISILSHCICTVPSAIVYDDGKRNCVGGAFSANSGFDNANAEMPKETAIVFAPGPIFNQAFGSTLERTTIIQNEKINFDAYYNYMEQSFRVAFSELNALGKDLIVTVPGISCSQFGGELGDGGTKQGAASLALHLALQKFLTLNGSKLPHIKGVWFDPYNSPNVHRIDSIDNCPDDGSLQINQEMSLAGILYCCAPSAAQAQAAEPPALYSQPARYFSGKLPNCGLATICAADALSWPGSDGYLSKKITPNAGVRQRTNEGAVAASTNVLAIMTRIPGKYAYDAAQNVPPTFIPLDDKDIPFTWRDAAKRASACLLVGCKDNVFIIDKNQHRLEMDQWPEAVKDNTDNINKLLGVFKRYLEQRSKTLWYRFLGWLHLSIRPKVIDAVKAKMVELNEKLNQGHNNAPDLYTGDQIRGYLGVQKIEERSMIFGLDKNPNLLEKLISKEFSFDLMPTKPSTKKPK